MIWMALDSARWKSTRDMLKCLGFFFHIAQLGDYIAGDLNAEKWGHNGGCSFWNSDLAIKVGQYVLYLASSCMQVAGHAASKV